MTNEHDTITLVNPLDISNFKQGQAYGMDEQGNMTINEFSVESIRTLKGDPRNNILPYLLMPSDGFKSLSIDLDLDPRRSRKELNRRKRRANRAKRGW